MKYQSNLGFLLRLVLGFVSNFIWVLALVLGTSAAAWSQTVLPVPALTARVMDLAQVLTPADRALLEAQSKTIQTQRGSEVIVLLVETTQPEPIEDYANRVANTWKLGRKAVGDGVLLVFAIKDRKARIEVARDLEGAIPDVIAKRMIRDTIAAAFVEKRYTQGIMGALQVIDARLAQESLPPVQAGLPKPNLIDTSSAFDLRGLLPFLIFGVVIGVVLRQHIGGAGPVVSAVGATGLAMVSGVVLVTALGLGLLVAIAAFILSSIHAAPRFVSAGGYGAPGLGSTHRSDTVGWHTGSHNSGGFSSSAGQDQGFSSGGGGDFGGGGASGGW